MRTHEELLEEVARAAASAPVDSDCPSTTEHGTYRAYRHAGCRCTATKRLVKVQRRRWSTAANDAAKQLERLIRRSSVRPEVVDALLEGRRREVRATHAELRAALRRALDEHGRDVTALGRRLNYDAYEIRRKLRKLDADTGNGGDL